MLVVAAHPDDEVLGGGGTFRRHVLEGDEVHALVACEGESVRYEGQDVHQSDHARRAAEILGFASLELVGWGDQRLDTMSLIDLVASLEERIQRLRPQIVYSHFSGDLNRDHRILAEAVTVACRPVEGRIEELLSFETPSSTEWNAPYRFAPNYFVDITRTLDDKLEAMACYESEIREPPHPRSLESLRHRASYWGAHAMMEAAEAFFVCRMLRR